jgi:hypothetical protein
MQHPKWRQQQRLRAATMMTLRLLLRLEDAAGVRPASGDAEVSAGNLTDFSSSWRTRPACSVAEETHRSSGATRKERAAG